MSTANATESIINDLSLPHEKAAKLTREKVRINELINFDKQPSAPVKVSVIVPVCNVEVYLRECLDSIVNQTLREIEIICVNDGSTDSSADILREYAMKDDRVKIIDKDNAGYGHAMNIGMDMAQGEYIGIVESDDFVDLSMYEELYRLAVENDVDYIKSDFNRFVYEDGVIKTFFNRTARAKANYNVIIDPHENVDIFRFVMNTWSGIYKRSFLVENNIRHNETPGASYQDNGFFFETACYAHRTYYVDKAYYFNRRDNPNSSVYSNSKLYCIRDEYNFIKDRLFSDEKVDKCFVMPYLYRKFTNYRFTYNRVNDEGKKEYLTTFYNEFSKDVTSEYWDWDFLRDEEKEELHFILDDPDGYYDVTKSGSGNLKISVIIPVYNESENIRECLESITSQSLREIEIICVDDGSTDNSVEIIQKYMEEDDRIVLLTQQNQGAGTARNYGMSFAKGEFICFMDADDFYPATTILRNLYISAKHNNVKICGGSFSTLNGKKVITEYSDEFAKYTFDHNGLIEYKDYQFDYGYHRFIYDRKMLVENNIVFPKYLRFQDPPFMAHAMTTAGSFYAVSQVVYRYRKNNAKLTWTREKVFDLVSGIKEMLDISREKSLPELHYLAVKRLNKDFLSVIMEFLTVDDIEFYLLVIETQHSISADLLKSINRCKQDEYFVIKPLYRILNHSNELASVKKKLEKAEKRNSDLELEVKNSPVSNYKKLSDSIELCNTGIRKVNRRLSSAIDDTKRLSAELTSVKSSFSFRVGRVITWLPRMIAKLFKR